LFEDDIKNMPTEEQEAALEYMKEFLELVSIGDGEYRIGDNGEIVIEN